MRWRHEKRPDYVLTVSHQALPQLVLVMASSGAADAESAACYVHSVLPWPFAELLGCCFVCQPARLSSALYQLVSVFASASVLYMQPICLLSLLQHEQTLVCNQTAVLCRCAPSTLWEG